jgi:hypothetical protein
MATFIHNVLNFIFTCVNYAELENIMLLFFFFLTSAELYLRLNILKAFKVRLLLYLIRRYGSFVGPCISAD